VQTYCRRQVCWRLERTGEQEGKKEKREDSAGELSEKP